MSKAKLDQTRRCPVAVIIFIMFHRFLSCSIVFYHVPTPSVMFHCFQSISIFISSYSSSSSAASSSSSSSIIINHHESSSIIINHQSSITTNQSINQSIKSINQSIKSMNQSIKQPINQPKSIKSSQVKSSQSINLLCNPPAGWFLEISRFFFVLSSSSTPPIRTSQYDVLSLCFRRLHFFCRLHIKTKSAWWFLKNMRSSVGIILPNRWKNKIHVSNHQPEISWASVVSFLGWLIVLHRIWGSVGLNRTAFCLMEEISNELDGVRNPDTKNHWETPWDLGPSPCQSWSPSFSNMSFLQ